MQEPISTSPAHVNKHSFAIGLSVLTIAAILLFCRLGHHALWDDEAYTALTGEGVMRTGDTSAILGHNIFAWANGSTLRNLHDRFFPPLPAYLSAASMMIFGESAGAARLPFALCGLMSIALLLRWTHADRVDGWSKIIFLFLLLTNVSLILFCRQCRYYGPSIFLCVSIAFLYLHHRHSTAGQLAIVAALAALFATQYFCFAAVVGCGVVDYAIWGRQRIGAIRSYAAPSPGTPGEGGGEGDFELPHSLVVRNHPNPLPGYREKGPDKDSIGWRRLLLGATLLGTFIAIHLTVWSPLGPRAAVLDAAPGTIIDRLQRIWWNLRDTHVNEFWNLALLLLAPVVGWINRDNALLRGCCAFVVCFLIVSAISPHGSGKIGEVRYFCALIPLACFLEARTLQTLFAKRPINAVLVAVVLAGTNLFSFGPFTALGSFPIPIRSTFAAYVAELIHPAADPYRVTSDWLNGNVPANQTVLVLPEYSTYPLMFHAPGMQYAWQLSDPPAKQFQFLPAINFRGRIAPDYVVIFGEQGQAELKQLHSPVLDQQKYIGVATLPIFAKDAYRPELFLRCFGAPPAPDHRSQAIYILRRQ